MTAINVVILMESSMQGTALTNSDNVLHSCFPDDPVVEFKNQGIACILTGSLQLIVPDDIYLFKISIIISS